MYVQYLFHTISILVSYRGRYPGVAAMIAEENYFTFIHIPASCHKQYLQNASQNLIDALWATFFLSVNRNHFILEFVSFSQFGHSDHTKFEELWLFLVHMMSL